MTEMTSVPVTRPPGKGWQRWLYSPPCGFAMVEAWRREWGQVHVLEPHNDPSMDVFGLYWRPVAEGGEPVH
jgi:hypothetical protein